MEFKKAVESLRSSFSTDIASVSDRDGLETLRVKYFGRKGLLSDIMREIKDLRDVERKDAGQALNDAKKDIEVLFGKKEGEFESARYAKLAEDEWVDVSLPGIVPPEGHLHITTTTIRDIEAIFTRLGFTRVCHPEVDWEYYAFESLRVGADHPARDNWETYFMDAPAHEKFGRMILTPHTTNGDVREMERGKLPIRTMNIGKTYRRQSDATHVPMFHQFEGLWVDKGITLANLKGVLDVFAKEFFGKDRITRLRPHHFRFTEPSFEVDISCDLCDGGKNAGCKVCKQGWLELGGAGMLHPDVLCAGGVDPNVYSALAFGWGVERTASMRAGIHISDLRVMYANDVRFLKQF
ncbi:MAG: phenylalanine--tRNA ligase subunit alpha [Patescibacteria group bacterium]